VTSALIATGNKAAFLLHCIRGGDRGLPIGRSTAAPAVHALRKCRDAATMAGIFAEALKEFGGAFNEIAFTVTDRFGPFQHVFAGAE
jgi:hypothetical protein